jgi:hypothetical protein
MINNKIAYTDEMLSKVFRVDVGSVTRALTLFQQLEMIEVVENAYMIANWDKHQSGSSLDKIKEQNRERQKRFREKQKLLALENDDSNVTVTSQSNVNCSISNSISNSYSLSKDNKEIKKDTKHKYGEYKHILLTDKELDKLNTEYGELETQAAIKYLDEYIEMKGTKYKSHYLALRKWVYSAVQRDKKNNSRSVMDEWANA